MRIIVGPQQRLPCVVEASSVIDADAMIVDRARNANKVSVIRVAKLQSPEITDDRALAKLPGKEIFDEPLLAIAPHRHQWVSHCSAGQDIVADNTRAILGCFARRTD